MTDSPPWSAAHRATFAALVLASLVFLPYLGSVGLWDPWETHYAEVAREMIDRGDFIHPHWERASFFSKPALTMWLGAAGMLLATRYATVTLMTSLAVFVYGLWRRRSFPWAVTTATSGVVLGVALWTRGATVPWKLGGLTEFDGALPLATEWGIRLPFAMSSIAAVGCLTWALSRVVSPRVGFAAGFILTTMPLCFLMARQAITDPLLVSATVVGVSCAMVALFDEGSHPRTRWWYGAWASFAVATLAKGWLGFLVPATVFLGYLALFVAERQHLKAELEWMKAALAYPVRWGLAAGLVVGLVTWQVGKARGITFISGPSLDGGLPGQGNDLLDAAQWHGLTWGALVGWLVATAVGARRPPAPTPPLSAVLSSARIGRGVTLFLALAFPWYYLMFTFSGRDDEGKLFWFRFIVHDHLARFFSGVFTTPPGGSFTYFLEQGGYAIFPWVVLVPGALAVAARAKVRGGSTRDAIAGIAALWLAVTWLSVGDSATKFHHYVFPLLPPMAILLALFVDELWTHGPRAHLVGLLLGVPLFWLVGKDLWTSPKCFTDLFVFNYDRPWPDFLVTRPVLGAATVKELLKWGMLGGLGLGAGLVTLDRRRALAGAVSGLTLAFALWFSWSFWVDLSHHWTQRDLFWRYATLSRPNEPIAAFLMNWRGETFYSKNQVVQIPLQDTAARLSAFLQRSSRTWLLVEHDRLGALRTALGTRPFETIEPTLNNKFVLVRVDSGGNSSALNLEVREPSQRAGLTRRTAE